MDIKNLVKKAIELDLTDQELVNLLKDILAEYRRSVNKSTEDLLNSIRD